MRRSIIITALVLVGCGGSIHSEGSVKSGQRCETSGAHEVDGDGDQMQCARQPDGELTWTQVTVFERMGREYVALVAVAGEPCPELHQEALTEHGDPLLCTDADGELRWAQV